jgi:histidinol-phosphate/aromatic aminotransferase/cobyric acid decarboxylase-like protein
LGIKTYPTETFFFLIKIPYDMSADEFSNRLGKRNIHVRPLHFEGMENRFVRFATSTLDNNAIVLEAIRKIFKMSGE